MSSIVETWPATAGDLHPQDGPVFMDAELAPNRSLANPAFMALMIAIAAISFTAGILFITIGAWPVTGFFGLDAVLVWLTFRISYRDGRAREWVRVGQRDIDVIRRHPTGHLQQFRLPTAWVRHEVRNRNAHQMQIALRAHGRALVLGSFLSPDERRDFAEALGCAIEAARAYFPPPQEPGGDVSAAL